MGSGDEDLKWGLLDSKRTNFFSLNSKIYLIKCLLALFHYLLFMQMKKK